MLVKLELGTRRIGLPFFVWLGEEGHAYKLAVRSVALKCGLVTVLGHADDQRPCGQNGDGWGEAHCMHQALQVWSRK